MEGRRGKGGEARKEEREGGREGDGCEEEREERNR